MSVFVVEKPQRQTTTYLVKEAVNDGTAENGEIIERFGVSIRDNKIDEISGGYGSGVFSLSARNLVMLQTLLSQLEKEGYALAYQTKEAPQA